MEEKSHDSNKDHSSPVSRSIRWYHPGESQTISVGGESVTVKYTNRKGRRARLVITVVRKPKGSS